MPLPHSFSLLVLGLGSTGADVAAWGLSHPERVTSVTVYGGAGSAPSDVSHALEERGANVVLGTEEVCGSFDVCVSSPGISEFSGFFDSARSASSQIMGEPEFAWRLSRARWCAVTGTNGKTTTTTLIDHLLRSSGLRVRAVGNIGTPCIRAVDDAPEGSWLAAELSSYQLACTSELHPRVAVLLNITPDHLAWHRSHEAYAQAKLRVFANMGEDDLAIVDVDDPGVAAHAGEIFAPGRRVLSLGLADPGTEDAAFLRDGVLTVRLAGEETALVPASELAIRGPHNAINALAASAAALACGAAAEEVREGLAGFRPLEHRVEPCGEIDGVLYVNDSKATNTDAVEKALSAFPGRDVIVLLGGHDKGTPLEGFAERVCGSVRAAVCFGEARERFRCALEDADRTGDVDIALADDLRDAVDVARSLACRGDVVLLSPACSSFDEFSGFEERGRAFKSYIEQLRRPAGDGEA